ncbi:MAG: polysaccharide biosynthesis tyrosine autokinase [Flavobacteriaceae bacterium]|nr:polysaccharide biosynthesis tyrosine autokinase [Flavobacteriaceae bacterium]
MIPTSNKQPEVSVREKEKMGSFDLFSIENFIRRVIRNWYWFVALGIIGYVISYVYNRYYVQRIYASNLSLSVSNNTASYFTPNQSINFIWGQGGNQDGVFLKKMLLSRSHNEYLVQKLNLFVDYSTKGIVKKTHLDKHDSPVFIEVDKNYLQQVNYPITLLPQGNGKYEVVLPEDGHSTSLYNYRTEAFEVISKEYNRPANKVVSLNQWYQTPNLRFRLIGNPNGSGDLENIIITLKTINETVQEIVSNISIEFDKELSSVMIITKRGYNLKGTVNFLNQTVGELIEKRKEDQSLVDRNTLKYINNNLDIIRRKLDSSAANLNVLKINKKLFDVKGKDVSLLKKIEELEAKKAEIISKQNSLNVIRNSVNKNLDNMINPNIAGIEDGGFNASISELKALYEKRIELASIYTPNSEPMREINRLIREARGNSFGKLNEYSASFLRELAKINQDIAEVERELTTFPQDQRAYMDVDREYKIIESTYNALLSKQAETQIRLATSKSDLTIIDPAKNLGQGPIGPNINLLKYGIIFVLMCIPLLYIFIGELLDTKIRSIKELVSAVKIPLLGVIGKSSHENNLTVLEQPKSSISESFRGIRANLRFLYKEDGKSKVLLVTSSVGGEGKTYSSINIASVLGLSGKKTILLGMDLRKPKIFGDFKMNNKYGISNYLSGDVEISQIINKTTIPTLDVATSGPIPPNPSELLMSDKNKEFIEELKKEYDFIVIDSPPVGLVADSFELMKLSDANIYVVRHEYTEKYMLKMIAEKYHSGEVSSIGIIYNDYIAKQGYGYFEEDKNYQEPFLIRLRNKVKAIFRK